MFLLLPLLALILPASLTLALPLSPSSPLSPSAYICNTPPPVAGYCDTLTYEDVTTSSARPPTIAQCQRTCNDIFADAGDWGVSFDASQGADYTQKLVSGGCEFKVGRGDAGNYRFWMDNQDIVDVINEAFKRFSSKHGGKVAARGTMRCEGHVATWWLG